jgi:dUTP pyrophosphatase
MNIYVIEPDEELAPSWGTKQSSGIDLKAREEVVINPHEYEFVPMNVIIDYSDDIARKAPPDAFTMLMFPRSSLFKNKGLILANSVGVIDPDYNGPGDEVKACLFNPTDVQVIVAKGEKLVQIVMVQTRIPKFEILNNLDNPNKDRGGVGSTGGYKGV